MNPGPFDVTGYGEAALMVRAADDRQARLFAAAVRAHVPAAVDVVPALDSVLVTFDHLVSATEREQVRAALSQSGHAEPATPTVILPVTYDGEDLHHVAGLLGFSPEQVVARHLAGSYTVAALGFAPGFAYLTGLDPALTVPRLDSPRPRIAAGSVGLAAGQTCVYPSQSPGGWSLIGRTGAVLFDAERPSPALLTPGSQVKFVVADRG